MAREVILGKKHDQSVDIWALGVTLVVAMSGFFPFTGDEYEYAMEVMLGEPNLGIIADWKKGIQDVVEKSGFRYSVFERLHCQSFSI
jgi:serine/threonine protein kinase